MVVDSRRFGSVSVGVALVVLLLLSAVASGGTGGYTDDAGAVPVVELDDEQRTVVASDDDRATVEGVSPRAVAERYNEVAERVPALIDERFADDPIQRAVALGVYELAKDRLADQVVELRVTTDDGDTVVYTVTTDDAARIVSYDDEATDDETMRVVTDETTLRELATADDPVTAAVDAYERGDITVDATGGVDATLVRGLTELAESTGR